MLNSFNDNNNLTLKNNNKSIKSVSLNFGPQHPAAHGVLRLILQLNNEVIINCDPHVGLLHRGTEKLIENKIYIHALPYFDRLDYVSTLSQESVYCLAVDKMYNFKKKNNSLVSRTVLDELTRILNHMLAISCHALDVGSMSTIFWSFEERENIMEIYESISGARMHTALYKPIFNFYIKKKQVINMIFFFLKNSLITINEMHTVLTNNKVWKKRLIGVGSYDYKISKIFGLSGVLERCTGLKNDIRISKINSYNIYNSLSFFSYTSTNGDSYDRYILRLLEMLESLSIINQSLTKFYNILYKKNNYIVDNMESVIKHFKYWSVGLGLKKNIISNYIESPKGELSITLFSDNSEKPYRCKIKSPSLNHLFFLKKISKGMLLSDLVTLIGTIDIVFGEIDR